MQIFAVHWVIFSVQNAPLFATNNAKTEIKSFSNGRKNEIMNVTIEILSPNQIQDNCFVLVGFNNLCTSLEGSFFNNFFRQIDISVCERALRKF